MIPQTTATPLPNRSTRPQTGCVIVTLDEQGHITDCSAAIESLFGYPGADLAGRHVSVLFPELEKIELLRNGNVNSRIAFLCHCGKTFGALRRTGEIFDSEIFISKVGSGDTWHFLMVIRGVPPLYASRGSEQ